jgi:hypothetical protein
VDCLNWRRPVLRKPVTVLNLGSNCVGASAWRITDGLVKDTASKRDGKRRDHQTNSQLALDEPAQTSLPGHIRT